MTATPPLLRAHEAPVAPEEIDRLGHLSTLHYRRRFREAVAALPAPLGIAQDLPPETLLAQTDKITLFQREQFEGAPMAVEGGVIAAAPEALTVYLELLNTEDGTRAAATTQKVALLSREGRRPVPFPEPVLARVRQRLVVRPAHGTPRTLDFTPLLRPKLADLERLDIVQTTEPPISPDYCDAQGFLALALPFDLVFDARTSRERPHLFFGFPEMMARGCAWPVLEMRDILFERPRQGDVLKFLIADLALERRTRRMRYYCYNADTGRLLALKDQLVIAMDLTARRSLDVPDEIRALLEPRLQPQLFGDPPAPHPPALRP